MTSPSGKYYETKFLCKNCGNNNTSPNIVENLVRGWKCNICGNTVYPIRDEIRNSINTSEKE